MAIMASQSPEPALPDLKSVKPTDTAEKDERNGAVAVNGHTSSLDATSDATSAVASGGKENGETNGTAHETKVDASASSQPTESEAQSAEASEPKLAQSAEDVQTEPEKSSVDETAVADGPAESSIVENEKETAPAAALGATDAPTVPDVVDQPGSADANPDVEMADVSAAAAVPASTEPAASTNDTSTSEPALATPTEDAKPEAASPANDATPASAAPATTADTSMSDAPQTAVKVARDREDDDGEEGPAAKRLKTDTPGEGSKAEAPDAVAEDAPGDAVEVNTGQPDAMAVDQPHPEPTSLYQEDGRPKNLADPSLDGNEITKYMANKLRGVLASVKKTKAGLNFKAPVQQLWPFLWDEYKAKVSEPTDISTMEKRLKGAGDPQYPPYPSLGAFKRDVELILTNSQTFNGAVHTVTESARNVRDQVFERMKAVTAVEVAVEKKEATKQHPTRHAEPRNASQPSPAQPPRRQSKPAAPSPVDKTAQSPAFAIPPNNHGLPMIRRDSTKNADDRPKRTVHPPKSKDFGYDVKKKNKLAPELRFCREVLDELIKGRHHDINQDFMQPVDPIALHIPNYYKVIRKPMDLQTMGEKLNTGQYANAREFEKDFAQIVKNAVDFNGENSHVATCAARLDEVFRQEWSKKTAWMAKHAPATAAPQASRGGAKHQHDADSDEDDDEDSDDEADDKAREPAPTTNPHLEALQSRLKEEQDKLNGLMMATAPDMSMVEVSQQLIALMQKQLIEDRQKLAEAAPPPSASAKKAGAAGGKGKQPAKGKKAGAAGAGGGKKAGAAQGAGASGAAAGGAGSKKAGGAGGKKAKRHMGSIEKEVVGAAIPDLEGTLLERAIDIIKKDTHQNENDSGELELDIEALSQDALTKLYDLSIKTFPHLRAEKEAEQELANQAAAAAAAAQSSEAASAKPKTTKPKKNKPMGKAEQEARLRQLAEQEARLRHLADLKQSISAGGRGSSNSQEPMESIEGNGGGGGGSAAGPAYESDEEESSEEE